MKSRKSPPSPDAWFAEIPRLLQREDIAGARSLLARALRSTDEPDERLSHLARVLAPPRVFRSAKQGRDHSRDYLWLQTNAPAHAGQWVALLDGVLVAAADSLKNLRAAIAEHPERESLLIHRIE